MASPSGGRAAGAVLPPPPTTESVFASFDRDGNAKLDFEEFVAMQPQRVRDLHSEGEMFQWYQDADENGDGLINFEEWKGTCFISLWRMSYEFYF